MKACAIIAAFVVVVAPGTLTWATDNPLSASPAPQAATYIGSAACGDCHQQQLSRWRGSHHDRAMQAATKATIVANFDNTTDGNWIHLRAQDDGSFTLTNGRNGFTRAYPAAPATAESRSGP